MIDVIFNNYRKLTDEDLEGYAKEVGLDIDQFKTDFVSEAVKAEVQKDMKAAQASGQVRGTPTILINGAKYAGPRTLDGFKSTIDAEIKKADALIKGGTKIEQVYEKLCKSG